MRGCRCASLLLGLGTALLLSACREGTTSTNFTSIEGEEREAVGLQTLSHVPVDPAFLNGAVPFNVLKREDRILHLPCSTCHVGPLEFKPDMESKPEPAHPDLVLVHAGKETMDCSTCHFPEGLDQLVSLKGTPVAYDHAYQVCASCHFQQAKDWAGGAHGKRMAGWRGERVVMNCTECHNPHAPAFDQRWPAKMPRIPRKGSNL